MSALAGAGPSPLPADTVTRGADGSRDPREGEDGEYFRLYSEKIAYPLAINIVFYVLTH